jgi:hypothetical protein
MLQGDEEQVLFNTDLRKGSCRVGIIGITEADQRSGFSIGVHFLGASSPKVDDA